MNKCAVYMLSALLLTVFILVTAYSQDDMMFVDNSVFSKPERTAAVFEHDAHNEMAAIEACDECHHIYEIKCAPSATTLKPRDGCRD